MRKYRSIIAGVLLLGTLLLGCQSSQTETTPTEPPVTTAQPTVPVTSEPTVPPTTQPEILLEAGLPVTVDGDLLASGSVMYDEQTYVKAAEFLNALDDAQPKGDDASGYTLEWENRQITFDPADPSLLRYQDALYLPVEPVCQGMNISLFHDEERSHLYCTPGIIGWEVPQGINVPVLMYHAVSDDIWSSAPELFVSPDDMDAQIAYLMDNGYDPIHFEDLAHLEDYDKPVILTFDDGYMDNYTELYPILQKFNCKATIFVVTGSLDYGAHSMTWAAAREMHDSGLVSIQSHTYSHAMMDEVDEAEMQKQLWWSKLAITRYVGREPFVLCFPSGRYTAATREMTMEYYRFGIAMVGGMYTTGEDVSQVDRYYVSRYTTMDEFAAMVSGAGTRG